MEPKKSTTEVRCAWEKRCVINFLFSTPVTDDESKYLDGLLADGAKTQVDVDVDAYELQLPPWYDDEKFKR